MVLLKVLLNTAHPAVEIFVDLSVYSTGEIGNDPLIYVYVNNSKK